MRPRPIVGPRLKGGAYTIIGWFAVQLLGHVHGATPAASTEK